MLRLKQSQVDRIVAHVQTEAPLEASGLLAGRGSTVERVYCMDNAEQSETTYRLDPEEQYRVFMEMEQDGLDLIGIYHSHPKSRAYPSTRDVDMAYYPEVVYLIVSLMNEEAPEMGAFRIENGVISAEDIEVVGD